jgi:chemotaxis protein MotA
MAVALLTTLYGALIANLVALPIADKLELRSQQERINHMVIINSISAIQQGQNPRLMDELLEAYLPVRERILLQAEAQKAAAESKGQS